MEIILDERRTLYHSEEKPEKKKERKNQAWLVRVEEKKVKVGPQRPGDEGDASKKREQ